MRKTKLSEKELKAITANSLREVRDRGYGRLRNYGNGKPVHMKWNINRSAEKDTVFKLQIGSETAYLDAEEVQKFLRWV